LLSAAHLRQRSRRHALLVLGFLGHRRDHMFLGNLGALVQTNVKRLLATAPSRTRANPRRIRCRHRNGFG